MRKGIVANSAKLFGGKYFVSLVILSLLCLIFSGCGPTASDPNLGKTELKLAHFFPANHPAETELIQPWSKEIAEATEGRVIITSYPSQTLLQADGIYDGVVSGIADLGLSCFSYTRGSFPVLEVFELPGIVYANSQAASKTAWEGIKELNPKEVQDSKLLMVFTTGPGDLYTKLPVRTLNDLQGLQIRATGLSAKTLEALGAVPVAMAQSEAYESLAKGVVQGNLGPIEVLQGWKQAEVTDYLTLTPFLYNTLFFVSMNINQWNSLDSQDQEAIERISEKYFAEVAIELWDSQNESALKYAVDEKGMTVINLSPEEQAKWISQVKPIQDNYVAQMNEKGYPGQEILGMVKKLAENYNKEFQ
ncbi:MAG: TRAP transporter substrate-binding protein [Desulfitobacteriia bacterium]|jgi:TRAP-type C4-dicarboxylate transport system substrate-binding protein